jgi:hypothetical protein
MYGSTEQLNTKVYLGIWLIFSSNHLHSELILACYNIHSIKKVAHKEFH